MTDIVCALDAKALLGEGQLWDPAAQRLYWVDIKRRLLHRFDPASGGDESWSTPEDVGSLAVRAKGGLVVAMKSGFHFFDPAAARFTPIVNPERDRPGNRFNDGKPDRQGRFWAGSMDDSEKSASGGLYRLTPDLGCHGRRHHLLEFPVLECRQPRHVLCRQLSARDLGLRLRAR